MRTFVLLLLLCVPFAAQEAPKQDEPKLREHTDIIIDLDPIVVPEVVNPDKCMVMQACTQRLLLKS